MIPASKAAKGGPYHLVVGVERNTEDLVVVHGPPANQESNPTLASWGFLRNCSNLSIDPVDIGGPYPDSGQAAHGRIWSLRTGKDWAITNSAKLRTSELEANGRRPVIASLAMPWTMVQASNAN
jgi:hypothetical protein